MPKMNYNISEKQINKMYNYAEEIYLNLCLLRLFCKEYYDVEDAFIIKPIIEYTYKSSDLLYAELIELQAKIERC